MSGQTNFFWFRRDLRLNDNHGLFEALESGKPVQCVFIFDRNILDKLVDRADARVTFIHQQLESINNTLQSHGGSLITYYGTPEDAWKKWSKEFEIGKVFTNHDYEPYARERDASIWKNP